LVRGVSPSHSETYASDSERRAYEYTGRSGRDARGNGEGEEGEEWGAL
jgi:hypothetical protein